MERKSTIRRSLLQDGLHQNVIKITRKIIRPMTETQRFAKAKAHIIDALKYKNPRFESESLATSRLFKILLWQWLLFFCGYVFLILATFDNQSYAFKVAFESAILFLFWMHMGIVIYCKRFDNLVRKAKYSKFFYFKLTIIILMTADLILLVAFPCDDCRPIRPFRIFRCFVPVLFDPQMRKSLMSLGSAYKDVLVYFVFYAVIIMGYSLVGNRALTFDPNYKDPNYPVDFDQYKTNYRSLQKMVFMTYVFATYDAFPDNQLLAIQNYQPNYLYYIAFLFFNMFVFSSIPGSLIYLRYRDTRSKILLVDQIRQQHSLIIAFVTLAENQTNLPIDKLIKFLHYLYRYKIRYIGYITQICLKLDDHNNQSIQVNQFMQLCKILLQNSAMMPPAYDDINAWIRFRKFVDEKIHLKRIVKHWAFSLVVSIIIILSFINDIYYLYNQHDINVELNIAFISIFVFELALRLVAIGPENFFNDKWNVVDSSLILISFMFYLISDSHIDGLVIIWRIFRIGTIFQSKPIAKRINFHVYLKLKKLFEVILEIMPIIIRFLPLFVFFFYLYAAIAIEVFYNIYDVPGNPAYNQYQQYGNFKTFTRAHYVLIQILVEAGWSQIAYDHASRSPENFVLIMLFFCILHITITYIIATLIKGVFWEVFFTVDKIFEERKRIMQEQEAKQKEIIRKSQEILQISQTIENNQYIEPNTILKRQLIENKFDQQIFRKLRKIFDNDKKDKNKLRPHQLISDWQLDIDHLSQKSRSRYIKKRSHRHRSHYEQQSKISHSYIEGSGRRQISEGSDSSNFDLGQRMSMRDTEQIDEEDLYDEIMELLGKLMVNPNSKYHQIVAHPRVFVQFLRSKFKRPQQLIKEYEFNLSEHPLHNQDSMYYHIYEMNALLDIEVSKRQQKSLIIKNLIEENVITEEQGERLIKKKLHEHNFNIDTSGTLRKMFLAQTNEELIRKFQIEYFSDLYGYYYKQINLMTLQPLLKVQATLTYSLRNIMRYPQINNTQFFEVLTNIEDKISNQLLKKGSLFKFVYKLKYEGDIWFSIQYRNQNLKVHFLKSGLWCYTKDMVEKNTMYAQDIFNWDFSKNRDAGACQKYIKLFYQSFQTLAFSLINEERFFQYNPKDSCYDLFVQHFDVLDMNRLKVKKLPISKIMVVILSHQAQRVDLGLEPLKYQLSDIEIKKNNRKAKGVFEFDQTDDKTISKLKNLAALEVQKIIQTQGLPFAYIINLMKEISDVIQIYGQNFVFQIQKTLNEKYEESKEQNIQGENGKSFSVKTMKLDGTDSVRLL